MITDTIVLAQLGKRPDILNNSVELLRIETMLNKEKVLTKPVEKIVLKDKGVPVDDTVATCFNEFYQLNYPEVDGDFTLEVGGIAPRVCSCDRDTFAMLKAIIMLGITPNQNIAIACRELFYGIIKLSKETRTVTKEDAYTLLNTKTDIPEKRLVCRAILATCYSTAEVFRCDVLATLPNDAEIDKYITGLKMRGIDTMKKYKEYIKEVREYCKKNHIKIQDKYEYARKYLLDSIDFKE